MSESKEVKEVKEEKKVEKVKNTRKKNKREAQKQGLIKSIKTNILNELSERSKIGKSKKYFPKTPDSSLRNVLITSALPYVNNVPHLGNIIGCVLSADVFNRFCHLRGYNSLFICGTDEYGTVTEKKAAEEGVSPQVLCDKYFKLHKEIYDWFNIDFDYFGRSSNDQQEKIMQNIYFTLNEKGYISEVGEEQLYCIVCDRYLADRFVRGICPTKGCGAKTNGDQCEKCQDLIDPKNLISPQCSVCDTKPVTKPTEHLYFDLPMIESVLHEWFDKTNTRWSSNAVSVTKGWFANGFKKRSITRDLKWGTFVPRPRFTEKKFYSWIEALNSYISITADYFNSKDSTNSTDSKSVKGDWQSWWKNPQNVELHQFLGKDNIPFHSIIWPSLLLATGEEWTLVNKLCVTEYLMYCGSKFSKSKNRGVFGDDCQKSGIPADVWRYCLLANRPENSDANFDWSDAAAKNNSDLLGNLGNLIMRVLKYCVKNFDGKVPEVIAIAIAENELEKSQELIRNVSHDLKQYVKLLENSHIKNALHCMMNISNLANEFFQWAITDGVFKNKNYAAYVIKLLINIIYILAHLIQPFMPIVAEAIFIQLNLPFDTTFLESVKFDRLIMDISSLVQCEHSIGTPFAIFQRIEKEEVEAFVEEFSGDHNVCVK